MGLLSFLMFAVNIIFWVMAGALLGVGIWLAVDPNAGEILGVVPGMDADLYWSSIYIMISVGALVFLVAFLGCVGAMRAEKGHNVFLRLYFVIVKIIILLEFILIILIGIFWGSLTSSVGSQMYNDVHDNYINESSNTALSKSWNKMQIEWKCCGSYNYTDYRLSLYTNTTTNPVPYTCCVMAKGKDGSAEGDVLNKAECHKEASSNHSASYNYVFLNAMGCYEGLTIFVDENSAIIIGITCGFIGLQVLGSILACILMRKGHD